MHRALAILVLFAAGAMGAAQSPERLDALSFTLPEGDWRRDTVDGARVFTREVAEQGLCRIAVYRATGSQGSLQADAASDWARLIQARYPGAALSRTRTEPVAGGAWAFTQQIASAQLGGTEVMVSVHTFTGHGQRMSVVFESTHPSFDSLINVFINGSRLHEPERTASPSAPAAGGAANGQPTALVGKWRRSVASYSHWGTNYTLGELSKLGGQGTSTWLYDFQAGGTYTFVRKWWPLGAPLILYLRESGTWRLEGDVLSVQPTRSVAEAWTKQAADKQLPDRLQRSEPQVLAPTRYRMAWHFWSGQRLWNLSLRADAETERDGSFHGGGPYPNGWYFSAADPQATLP